MFGSSTHNKLSTEVVDTTDKVLGSGAFGVVKLGKMVQLGIPCAIKFGKTVNYYDAFHESAILQRLQESKYFPHLFGVMEKRLVMEFILYREENGLTVYRARNDNLFDQTQWTNICYDLIRGLIHLHKQGVLHNDIKSNNILLRQDMTPVYVDFGKATLRKSPEVYKLNDEQRERYNKHYPYIAYELRNQWGKKTSTATDIFSLGFVFQYVSTKDNVLLNRLQKLMQEKIVVNRISSPDILRQFKHWALKNNLEYKISDF